MLDRDSEIEIWSGFVEEPVSTGRNAYLRWVSFRSGMEYCAGTAGGNGDMEVHTSAQRPISSWEDLVQERKLHLSRFPGNQTSQYASDKEGDLISIMGANLKLFFSSDQFWKLLGISGFATIRKSGSFPLANQRNWSLQPITTSKGTFSFSKTW